MRILGIETSCDDTGIALLEVIEKETPRFHVLTNIVSSQIKIHQKYGGVYPMLAKREHEKNLPIVLRRALDSSPLLSVRHHDPRPARTSLRGLLSSDAQSYGITAIAVTYGPGLSPCLWTGLNFAKNLAKEWSVPLIPIDHIEAHMLIGILTRKQANILTFQQSNIFPAVALIVSGGHTQLALVNGVGDYKIIGETRDDAAGECFDKTARILGLEYPGGPAIAAKAAQIQNSKLKSQNYNQKFKIKLPRPMLYTKDHDFSFSGLKTAVLYDYKARHEKERVSEEYIREMAHEIQQAIVDILVSKTMRASKEYGVKSVILGGGVAANESLRARLKESAGAVNVKLLAPPPNLATDNGAMIALAGYFKYKQGAYPKNPAAVEANPNLRIA